MMMEIFFNYSLAFIIIFSEIIFISEGKMVDVNNFSPITDEYINLAKFERAVMMVTDRTRTCPKYLRDHSYESTSSDKKLNLDANICRGSIDNCKYFAGPGNYKHAQYCMTTDRKELKWAVSSSEKWYGPSPLDRTCKNHIKIRPNRQHCYYLCNCIGGSHDELQDNWSFSLMEQQSNVALNKVVTGIQFVKINKTIHLQIREATPLSDDNGIWRSSYMLKNFKNTDIATVNGNRRSLHLSLCILPPHYVVTGVKFVKTDTKINIEIQGTKFNRETNELQLEDQQWFTSDDAQRAYMKVTWTPSFNALEIIKPMFPSIEFSARDIVSDLGNQTYPHLYAGRITMKHNNPIRAVRLSIVKTQHGDTVVPQIAGFVKYMKLTAFPDAS